MRRTPLFPRLNKALKLDRLVSKLDKRGRAKAEDKSEKASFLLSEVTHGYHVEEDSTSRGLEYLEPDKVVAHREQIGENELWLFGVFDARIDDAVTNYVQAHWFDKKLNVKESGIRRKSEETLKMAHLNVRAKIREKEKGAEEGSWELPSSATAIVINGKKLVIADMGEYKAVLCRNGQAFHINRGKHGGLRSRWSPKFISGAIRRAKERFLGQVPGDGRGNKPSKGSGLDVVSENIHSDTEFLILASIGIWEVMKHQEAIHLIRHIENAQEAADTLAKEAVTRNSKSNISCLIVRFH